MQNDMPNIWTEDEVKYDPETGEILEDSLPDGSDVVPFEEQEVPLPTIAEQKDIVNSAELSEENKSLFGSLIEMNQVANVLEQIRSTETAEKRKNVILTICESFINARFRNNMVAEQLKQALLLKLLTNIDNLDLQTASQILTDIHDVTGVDTQQALSAIMGGGSVGGTSGGSGINLTINNATAEGSQITTNTLNANPQQVQQLKEVASLNSSLRAWQNIPGKKQPVQAQIVDETKK